LRAPELQYLAKSVFSKSAGPNKDERDIGWRDQEFRAENPRQGGLHDVVIDRGDFSGFRGGINRGGTNSGFSTNGPIR
jgi:hypothetical protein